MEPGRNILAMRLVTAEVLAQGKSLDALGPAGHAARLGGGAGEVAAEDAATAGDHHPLGLLSRLVISCKSL